MNRIKIARIFDLLQESVKSVKSVSANFSYVHSVGIVFRHPSFFISVASLQQPTQIFYQWGPRKF